MNTDERPPLTDSPWFWVLAFSLMALLALAVMNGKYGRRQSGEERKYQAVERIAAGEKGSDASSEATNRRPYSTPGETLIPLWPLTLIMLVISVVALAMLFRERRRAARPTARHRHELAGRQCAADLGRRGRRADDGTRGLLPHEQPASPLLRSLRCWL